MKISAVVPTYNNENVIGECLNSLLLQTRKFDEIIVVDDGSTDSTPQIIEKYPVKVIRTDHKERSHARNVGWKNAEGDIIAFIESDSVYNNVWVENILEGFKNGADAVIDRRAVYKPKTFIAKLGDEIFDLRYRNYVPFSAWAFKKEVLEKLGGFDENITGPEDVELGLRLIKNNFKIVFVEKAVQFHKGEPTSFLESLRRSWWFGKHMYGYYKKHPEKKPSLKLLLYIGLTILILVPPALALILIVLYCTLLTMVLCRGMKIKYALAYPIYTIFMRWPFYLGIIYAYFKK